MSSPKKFGRKNYVPKEEPPIAQEQAPKEEEAKKSRYHHLYKEAQTHIWYNDEDPDLVPIKVALPTTPPLHTIDGYGLPPEEQKFTRRKMPDQLNNLIRQSKTIDNVWDTLLYNRHEYIESLNYIRWAWNHRINGYWCFINGVPTYIDGWHFFYLHFWHMESRLPTYRSRDRQWFIFARFCFTDTTSVELDDNGKPIVIVDDGRVTYKTYDTGNRTCLGFTYPKHRREGATSRSACIHYEVISRTNNANGGIVSMTGDKAEMVLTKHIAPAFKKMPFFFVPRYQGSDDPKAKLVFNSISKSTSSKGASINKDAGLDSQINFSTTSDPNFYDGYKLFFLHDDETGKTELTDVSERQQILAKSLLADGGGNFYGFYISTSTVGEMEGKGGDNYYKIIQNSHWQKRNLNGTTQTGLYTLFMPAYDGLGEGYIDEYGNSIIDRPTWQQETFTKKKIGARQFLDNQRSMYLSQGDIEKYNEECRLNPTRLKECFLRKQSDTGFNVKVLEETKYELMQNKALTIRGDFAWTSEFGSPVIFVDNPHSGKWVVSKLLDVHRTNKKLFINGQWAPDRPRFVISADPFKNAKSYQKKRLSLGAGCVFEERDYAIDGEGKDPSNWETYNFCATYLHRTETDDEYNEDMLKACIYYNGMFFPENNVDHSWMYFERMEFGGYLRYESDPQGKERPKPGFNSNTGSKQSLFDGIRNFVNVHGRRVRHIELIKEWLEIRGTDDMPNRDLFVASAGCLKGSISANNLEFEDNEESYVDLLQLFPSVDL
jgi:hypothetical protein